MDDARLERLTRMVGGRYRLASLVQKRIQELVAGQRTFGDSRPAAADDLMERVLREIEEGRIVLQLPGAASGPTALPEKGPKE